MPNIAPSGRTNPFQEYLLQLIAKTVIYTREKSLQFILPETVFLSLLDDEQSRLRSLLADKFGVDVDAIKADICEYLDSLERVPKRRPFNPGQSANYNRLVANLSHGGDMNELTPADFFEGLAHLSGSEVKRIIDAHIDPVTLSKAILEYERLFEEEEREIDDVLDDYPDVLPLDDEYGAARGGAHHNRQNAPDPACRRIDDDDSYTSLDFIGRATEIDKSIVTLLKSNRSNIVFVGERGVGKTSMVRGLIQARSRFKASTRFGKAMFYKFNPSAVVTGVSYADEIENHVASIIDDIQDQGSMAVIFADNMSELMPQHQNDNTPDTLRLILSLIEGKDIHLVTTASFDQYKKLNTFNKSVDKHFTRIDIAEPPLEPDGRKMVHSAAFSVWDPLGVVCQPKVIDHIIDTAVASYSKDIAMPGRAIDLMDSVCAHVRMECDVKRSKSGNEVTQESVDNLLKMFGCDTIATSQSSEKRLQTLEPNMLTKIFGQDEAVHGVAQSVLLAKAGLSDDTKPLAAYLFVGPTGVGKTELAKVLSNELGVKLVRFDMSEYSEQHTVSKLVGSPAGYIGYDDGGLLTDAVRKNPNCVLLFDEIEKAHTTVFNLLLQVLDYAQLTDNKGQKADFSGTVIIMTSNAGARFATGKGLGFGSKSEKSEVMGAELKKTFAPEFLNRLTQIVAFHDMTPAMAERILDRKVSELQAQLAKKRNVEFALKPDARQVILDAGFSSSYGAREMDRAIGRLLKPALMQALLFGGVADGDALEVAADGKDKLKAVAAPKNTKLAKKSVKEKPADKQQTADE